MAQAEATSQFNADGTAPAAATKKSFLQPEQRPTDHRADERTSEVFGTGPPEPSAAVRQLPASFPAVTPQRVQDAGLCCWKDQLLCNPGGAALWPEAISLSRGSAEGHQYVL